MLNRNASSKAYTFLTSLFLLVISSSITLSAPLPKMVKKPNYIRIGKKIIFDLGKWDQKVYHTGLDISVGLGAKTYWKDAGEAGIPTSINWERKENVKDIKISWPAPQKIIDGEDGNQITSYGYYDWVILPIDITPIDPSKPVNLAFELEYGICTDICLPGSATFNKTLSPTDPENKNFLELLDEFKTKAPKKISIKEAKNITYSLTENNGKLNITLKIDTSDKFEVFPIPPPHWAITNITIKDKEKAQDISEQVYQIELTPEEANDTEEPLNITLTFPDKALEFDIPLTISN